MDTTYNVPVIMFKGMPDNEHTPAAKSAQSTGDKLIRLIETANHYKSMIILLMLEF